MRWRIMVLESIKLWQRGVSDWFLLPRRSWPKATWKAQSLFGINTTSHNPLGKANAGIQSWNLDVGNEAEIIEECCLLPFSSRLVGQFLNNPGPHLQWRNWLIVSCIFPRQSLSKSMPSNDLPTGQFDEENFLIEIPPLPRYF